MKRENGTNGRRLWTKDEAENYVRKVENNHAKEGLAYCSACDFLRYDIAARRAKRAETIRTEKPKTDKPFVGQMSWTFVFAMENKKERGTNHEKMQRRIDERTQGNSKLDFLCGGTREQHLYRDIQ